MFKTCCFFISVARLSKRVSKQFYFDAGRNAFVKNVVDRIEYRHVHMIKAVNAFHTFSAIITLSNHFHFNLRRLYTVTFTNHGTKYAVARKV